MSETQPANAVDFEQALAALEHQVQRLEGGDLALEDALKAFEEGVRLTHQCQQSLDAAEQKVQLLLAKRDGSLDTEAFIPRDDS